MNNERKKEEEAKHELSMKSKFISTSIECLINCEWIKNQKKRYQLISKINNAEE